MCHKNSLKKTVKGFTLLEVMVVISIISILAGFLIPKFIGYENKAKTVKAISEGKQLYNAVMCAYSENGSSVAEDDVAASVNNLTGISVSGNVTKSGNTFNINYSSDSNNYTLTVDVSSGGYSIYRSGEAKSIFAQN